MIRNMVVLLSVALAFVFLTGLPGIAPTANAQTPLQIYGAWHC